MVCIGEGLHRDDSIHRAWQKDSQDSRERAAREEVESYVEKYRESMARIGFDVEDFARAYSTAVRVVGGPTGLVGARSLPEKPWPVCQNSL